MRYALMLTIICLIGSFCNSGCKKEENVVTRIDTVTVTVRDTVVKSVLRTDHYTGRGQLDCQGTCAYPADETAFTDVTYYSYDSTHFKVNISSAVGGAKHVFNFYIVKGKFGGKDSELHAFSFKDADSLKFWGQEPIVNMDSYLFDFNGSRR